ISDLRRKKPRVSSRDLFLPLPLPFAAAGRDVAGAPIDLGGMDGSLQKYADIGDLGGRQFGLLQALDGRRCILAPLNVSFHRAALAFEDSGAAQLAPDRLPSLTGLAADGLYPFLFHRAPFFERLLGPRDFTMEILRFSAPARYPAMGGERRPLAGAALS